MKSLEEIATDLLEGRISNEEARLLGSNSLQLGSTFLEGGDLCKENNFKNIKGPFEVFHDKILQRIDILNQEGLSAGYIDYFKELNSEDVPYIILNDSKTLIQNNGFFSKMFNELVDFGRFEMCSHIELEVDSDNSNALGVYGHLGFYPITPKGFEEYRSVYLRKDL